MLGWHFNVYPYRLRAASGEERMAARVASWETGLGGTDWIDRLAKDGRAVALGGGGYPLRFVISAAEILNVFEKGLPRPKGPVVVGDDYYTPPDWLGKATVNIEAIRKLAPSELLMIEAWDQS